VLDRCVDAERDLLCGQLVAGRPFGERAVEMNALGYIRSSFVYARSPQMKMNLHKSRGEAHIEDSYRIAFGTLNAHPLPLLLFYHL
jgi:hypothetical protein